MSRAQVIFAVALSVITALVLIVGVYVVSSTGWADRWYKQRRSGDAGPRRSGHAGRKR